jgi:hypothetical protein
VIDNDNFKTRFESCMNKCIFLMNRLFSGGFRVRHLGIFRKCAFVRSLIRGRLMWSRAGLACRLGFLVCLFYFFFFS